MCADQLAVPALTGFTMSPQHSKVGCIFDNEKNEYLTKICCTLWYRIIKL